MKPERKNFNSWVSRIKEFSLENPVKFIFLLKGVTLVTILVFWFYMAAGVKGFQFEGHDYYSYVQGADSILTYGTFSSYLDPTEPDNIRTPGLPIVIAVTKLISPDNFQIVFITFQAVLLVLFVLVFFKLTMRLDLKSVWYIPLVIPFFVHPEFLNAATSIQSEFLNAFLFLLFTYFTMLYIQDRQFHVKNLVIAGTCLSLAIYVRPTMLYFVPIYLGFIFFTHKRIRDSILVAVIVVMILGPWIVRNKISVSSYTFSSIQNINLAYFRAADLLRLSNKIDGGAAKEVISERLKNDYGLNETEAIIFQTKDPKILFDAYPKIAKEIMLDSLAYIPLSILQGLGRQFYMPHVLMVVNESISLVDFVSALKSGNVRYLSNNINIKFVYLYIYPYLVNIVIIASFFYLLFNIGKVGQHRWTLLFMVLYIAYNALIVSGGESNPRFVVPYYTQLVLIFFAAIKYHCDRRLGDISG